MIQYKIHQNKYGNGAHAGHDQDKPTHIKARLPSSFLPLITHVKPSLISEVLELKPVFSPPPTPTSTGCMMGYPAGLSQRILGNASQCFQIFILPDGAGLNFRHCPVPPHSTASRSLSSSTADPSTAEHQFLQLNLPPHSSFWWSCYLQKWGFIF